MLYKSKKQKIFEWIYKGNKVIIAVLLLYLLLECTIGGHKDAMKNLAKYANQQISYAVYSQMVNRTSHYIGYLKSRKEETANPCISWVSSVYAYAHSTSRVDKQKGVIAIMAGDEADEKGKAEGEEPEKDNKDKEGESEGKKQVKEKKEDNKNKEEKETPMGVQEGEMEASLSINDSLKIPVPKLTGTNYTVEQLSNIDFLLGQFYVVDSSTAVYKKDFPVKKYLNRDFKLTQDNSKPQILIYHTHSQEGFSDTVEGDKDTTIVGVGDYLTEVLTKQFHYNVIHNTQTFDLVDGVLDRSKAYDYAGKAIAQVLADNPSIQMVIDLHRDGVRDDLHLVTTVNEKPTAQIMFFNGMSRLKDLGEIDYLYNPHLKDNLALSLQMKLKAEAYYPGFTRRNYINAYEYNLNMSERCMLVEAGAQTNSVQEVKNAMEPLAMLLHMVLQ